MTVTNGFGSNTFTSSLVVSDLPSVDAGLDTTVDMNTTLMISATGTPTGGTYEWQNSEIECPECSMVMVSPVYTTTYTVTYTSPAGCMNTDEITITVLFEEAIGVPNGFSPNSDGMNDALFVEGMGITEMQVCNLQQVWQQSI